MELVLALLIGHAFADYPLQGDFIARFKSYREKFDGPAGPVMVWPYVLSAHALIHAGFVWAITGSVWLGVCELVAHWIIDLLKCGDWIDFHADQWMHIGCKLLWVVVLIGGVS
ncbi:hypothetical protein COB72_09365 [bacterium]|nr:MAG: hypothetical protein COB72_09365 [bacterium]